MDERIVLLVNMVVEFASDCCRIFRKVYYEYIALNICPCPAVVHRNLVLYRTNFLNAPLDYLIHRCYETESERLDQYIECLESHRNKTCLFGLCWVDPLYYLEQGTEIGRLLS